MSMLEVRNVSKRYGNGPVVLDSINLNVEAGELVFLLGSSGCGKSTLLRIVSGLILPDSGTVILDGLDITSLPPERRNTPMVFQNYALWPHLNVFDNVAFGLKARKLPASEIRKTVEEMLEVTGMSEFAKRKVNDLSGGQQQRVALARALALRGSILLLDEPLSNLDAGLRDRMRLEIRRICRERSLTALYVTHDRREALSIGDRIAIMRSGRILRYGSPRDLYRRPACRFSASFLGDAGFIPAECMSADSVTARFTSAVGEFTVELASQPIAPEAGHKYDLLFRPEAVEIGVPVRSSNSFICTIADSVFLGEITCYVLKCGDFTLHANETLAPDRVPGTPCLCRIAPSHLTILPQEYSSIS